MIFQGFDPQFPHPSLDTRTIDLIISPSCQDTIPHIAPADQAFHYMAYDTNLVKIEEHSDSVVDS